MMTTQAYSQQTSSTPADGTTPDVTRQRVAPDTDVLTAYVPAPGLGVLPVQAYVIRAAQPVLVDAGVLAMREQYLRALSECIALEDIEWIWLTHTDPDHIGCLREVLDAAPRARIVTTYLGMGKLGLQQPLAPDRVYLLNPGQTLDLGDRRLLAVKPPSFDAPETTGLFDGKTRALYSADCFGTLLTSPVESAAELDPEALCDGLVTWTTVDAPWLSLTELGAYERAVSSLRSLQPATVLSSHLPPAPGMFEALCSHLARARTAAPFVGPDQSALLQMLSAA
jgi:glyoxylase-like metal-dependent hydrolase (beta-lactamase superfamily II)